MSDGLGPSEGPPILHQLLRQQERVQHLMQEAKQEIDTPVARMLLTRLPGEATSGVEAGVQEVLEKIEDVLRAVRHCQSEIHRELLATRGRPEPGGPTNLPPGLSRFLVERKDTPGFTYEVRQDPMRGWIIHWKEYTGRGTVRGSGQFYERPYAWLEDS